MKRLKNAMNMLACIFWCHRATDVGLAVTFGAGSLSLIETEIVALVATALYVLRAAQRH